MFTTLNQANITANARTSNLLAGDINEFVTQRSIVEIYAVSSASSVNLTVLADSDVAVDDQEVVAIGTTLDKSQHLVTSFAVAPGTRLAVFLRETAGSSTTDVLIGINVTPV